VPKQKAALHKLGLLEGDEEGCAETLGDADGELEGPVEGSDVEGPVEGSDIGPEEGALLKLGLLEGDMLKLGLLGEGVGRNCPMANSEGGHSAPLLSYKEV
jgi:hypothetical protein